MDTTELYRLLLVQAGSNVTTDLIRTAAAHVEDVGDEIISSKNLLRDLTAFPNVPADVLARHLRHPDPTVRSRFLLHSGVEPEARLAALRTERSPIVLADVAARVADPDALRLLARRQYRGKAQVRMVTALLGNRHLLVDDAADLIVLGESLLAAAENTTDDLYDEMHSALTEPDIAVVAGPRLSHRRLLLAAARSGALDVAGWARIRQVFVDDVLAGVRPGETLRSRACEEMAELLGVDAAPEPLRRLVAETIVAHDRDSAQATQALRWLAGQEPTPDEEALLAVAAGDDEAALRALLGRRNLTERVWWQIAVNPAASGDVVATAIWHLDADGHNLGELFTAHPDPADQAAVVWELGPDSLALVPAEHRSTVLLDVLGRAGQNARTPYRATETSRAWQAYVAALDAATLASLPWLEVRALAHDLTSVAVWLTGELGARLAEPGARRVFAAVEETHTGTAGALFAAVAGVTAAA